MNQAAAQSEVETLLEPNPKLSGTAQEIAQGALDYFYEVVRVLTDQADADTVNSFQFTLGSQKLLEAKDCFVRVAVLAEDQDA